jgi:hypothetical protein
MNESTVSTTTSETAPAPEPDARVWLNAMKCVRPTDEFAAEVGHDLIRQVMEDGHPKAEPLDPYRRLTVEFVAS